VSHEPPRSRWATPALLAFVPLLALWSWKLLQPHPLPVEMEEWFDGWNAIKLVAAKTLHASVYATLTVLAGLWLPTRRPVLTFALSLLMFHGVLTEVLQTMIPNRSGRVWDVLIDWSGICVGLFAGRSRWRQLR
jgi:VanZ family protein